MTFVLDGILTQISPWLSRLKRLVSTTCTSTHQSVSKIRDYLFIYNSVLSRTVMPSRIWNILVSYSMYFQGPIISNRALWTRQDTFDFAFYTYECKVFLWLLFYIAPTLTMCTTISHLCFGLSLAKLRLILRDTRQQQRNSIQSN